MFMSVSYLTALLGRVEGGENVNRRLLRFLLQYMNRGTRTQTRPSAIPTVLTVPAIIRSSLSPGTGLWNGEAAIMSGVGVRIAGVGVRIAVRIACDDVKDRSWFKDTGYQ